MSFTFGSVCSGIEAASVAWHPLGWRAAWLAEIEPFPSAVLAHHYPEVPNLGDMTQLPEQIVMGQVPAPDLLCGGTPCQAFSVAGLRQSLDDARGNLSLTFCEIANAIDLSRAHDGQQPCIVFWENVPGVLNTKDNAFGCFLAGLAGEDQPLEPPGGKWSNAGYVSGPQRAVAWRVLDAQYFGVAQRRRRVFVVASARDDIDPAAILFEFEGVRRDSAPSRQAGEKPSPTIAGCANGGGANGPGRDVDSVESLVCMSSGQANDEVRTDGGTPALTCLHEAPIAAYSTKLHNTSSNQSGKFYEEYTTALDRSSPPPAVICPGVTHSLRGEGFDASEDGTGRGTPLVPVTVSLRGREGGATAELGDEVGNCLRASGGGGDKAHVLAPVAIQAEYYTHDYCNDRVYSAAGISPALNCTQDHSFRTGMQVRRLTPRECERLQGFPDDYTLVPNRGKPAADGPRYKALGNSWAVPNVRWIGWRIASQVFADLA